VSNFFKRLPISKALGLTKKPAGPGEQTPTAPTIDDAAKNRDEVDRIRRRRGVLANVFGGNAPGASNPAVGVKTLLGQ
jgi:hypothetical protein